MTSGTKVVAGSTKGGRSIFPRKGLCVKLVMVGLLIIMLLQIPGHEARGLPNASFTYWPIDPLAGQTITFTANGTLSPGTIYQWDFGNGTSLTTNTTTAHGRFTNQGIYTVSLTISDPRSSSTVSRSVAVFASIPLIASFSANPSAPVELTSAKFDASSSSDPNGTIVGYVWSYGDSSQNSTTIPVTFHQYASVGSYNATLTIIDSNGSNASSIVPVYVLQKVTVTVSTSSTQGNAPFTVSFTALAAGGQGSYTFAWTFGDGEIGLGQSVNHNYTTGGTYQVQVIVSDSAAPIPHLAFGSTIITVRDGFRLNTGPIPFSLLLNGIGVAALGTAILLLIYGVSLRRARRGHKGGSGLDPYGRSRSLGPQAGHGYDLDMMQNKGGVVFR